MVQTAAVQSACLRNPLTNNIDIQLVALVLESKNTRETRWCCPECFLVSFAVYQTLIGSSIARYVVSGFARQAWL